METASQDDIQEAAFLVRTAFSCSARRFWTPCRDDVSRLFPVAKTAPLCSSLMVDPAAILAQVILVLLVLRVFSLLPRPRYVGCAAYILLTTTQPTTSQNTRISFLVVIKRRRTVFNAYTSSVTANWSWDIYCGESRRRRDTFSTYTGNVGLWRTG